MKLLVFYECDETPQEHQVRTDALVGFFDALTSDPYPIDCVIGYSREPLTIGGALDDPTPTLYAVPNAYGTFNVERWPLEQLVSRVPHNVETWRRLFWDLAYTVAPDRIDALHYLLR